MYIAACTNRIELSVVKTVTYPTIHRKLASTAGELQFNIGQ